MVLGFYRGNFKNCQDKKLEYVITNANTFSNLNPLNCCLILFSGFWAALYVFCMIRRTLKHEIFKIVCYFLR